MVTFNSKDLTVDFKEYGGVNSYRQPEKQYKVVYTCATQDVVHYVDARNYVSVDAGTGLRNYVDTLTYAENLAAGLTRSPTIKIYVQTSYDTWSPALTVAANNPQSSFTTQPTVQATEVGASLKITKPADSDHKGYLVYMDTNNPPTTLVADTTATTVSLPVSDTATRYVRVAPYDEFGQDSLNYSDVLSFSKIQFVNGQSTAQVFLYQRAASAPAVPSSTVTYTFATGASTGMNNGWTSTIPAANGQPLYVTVATAMSAGATDTIATGEWASPVIFTQDGNAGANGASAVTVYLYQRGTSAPTKPSVSSTYTFSNAVLTGHNNGWQQIIPSGTGTIWVTFATAFNTGTFDTIAASEWTIPVVLAQTGSSGAQVFLYKRSASVPALPTVSTTYTYSSGLLTGADNGWTQTVPSADGNPLYVTVATASSNGTTDTIAANEWTSPTILTQDGAPGSTGNPGINSASVFLYQRAASTPSVPSVTTTYTFATGALASINNGWSQTVPASNGQPLYVTTATAASASATDTIATGEWATPSIMSQDGATGAAGLHNAQVFLYQRAASTPSVPSANVTYDFTTATPSGLTNGWLTTIPAGTNPLYVTVASASSTSNTDTIGTSEWTPPQILSQNGANGLDGTNGLSVATVTLYIRSASTPTKPSTTATYTFASGNLTGHNNGWTQAFPASNGQPCYAITATASAQGSATDTIPSTEWSTPVLLVQDGNPGATGPAGSNNATVTLYRRNATQPPVPSTTSTYTFATSALTGHNNSWTQAVPAGTAALWITQAVANSPDATDTIGSGEWATPVIFAQNGADGTPANPQAQVFLYRRTANTPATPSATVTYTFATGAVSGVTNSWTSTIPAFDGNPLWMISAVALGAAGATTDTINTFDWSYPIAISDVYADEVLDPSEKMLLIQEHAALEARYSEVTARAAALGISSTTLTDVRTNWLALLNSFSPLWNNTAVSTTIGVPLVTNDVVNGWTTGAGVSNTKAIASGYTRLNETDAANFGNVYSPSFAVTASGYYTFGVVVKKQTAGANWALIRVTNQSSAYAEFVCNSRTGGMIQGTGLAGDLEVLDLGPDWLFRAGFTMPAGSTSASVSIYPAIATGTGAGGVNYPNTFQTSATGLIDLQDVIMVSGPWTSLGRWGLVGRKAQYHKYIDNLQQAISATDYAGNWDVMPNRPGELTDGRINNALSSSGRLRNSRRFFSSALLGIKNTNNVAITGADVGSTATITIAAHSRVFPGEFAQDSVSYNTGTIPGMAFNTSYAIYTDDPDLLGGAVTYVSTTDANVAAQLTGRILVGTVTTPADGGTSTGGGGGWGGGGDGCVWADSYLADNSRAGDAGVGHMLTVLTEDGTGYYQDAIRNFKVVTQPCALLRTESGIELTCSYSTPIALRFPDGTIDTVELWDSLGGEVPVMDNGDFRYERIVHIEPAGDLPVCKINVNDGVYAAGNEKDRFIFTHNAFNMDVVKQ